MRYKELNDEELKKYLDNYFNLELLDKKPDIGDIAYEYIVNNRSIVIYSTNNYCGKDFKPIGVVFDCGESDVKIVDLFNRLLDNGNIRNGEGWYLRVFVTTNNDDGRINTDTVLKTIRENHIEKESNKEYMSEYPLEVFRYLKNDWYVPSYKELNVIYKNRMIINNTLEKLRSFGEYPSKINGEVLSSNFSTTSVKSLDLSNGEGCNRPGFGNCSYNVRTVRAIKI